MTQNKRVTWALGVLLLASCAPSEAAPPAAEAPLAAGVPVLNSGVAEVKPGEPWLMYEIGSDIHLARPDGTDQRLLTQERVVPGADNRHGDWSRDGSRVAFEVAKDDASVWVVDAGVPREPTGTTCGDPSARNVVSVAR